ncbi:DUF3164 family protein [Flavobacterium covae]|uniref:DUF3164 family protein n=1 Tax=Flavobacterium covae TaxID=2906076 RepID=UPI000745BEB7|nr:DUF3164 family protein [Flavobacterium covae]AMA49434.1 hypothetical protein AWN65_08175 [Flavobacterium covae]MCJ1808960.1 DUF3164 family protein [Flavobacterium covae]
MAALKAKLEDLTPEERRALIEEAKELDKKEKAEKSENTKVLKELSELFVNQNIDNLVSQHKKVEDFIALLFKDYQVIKELKAQVYGLKINNQDSHTSTLADGSASITIGYNVTIGFDGTESVGVEKIKSFINSLASEDENVKKLSKMVNTFLKPNAKTGMLNPVKIIELSKLRDDFNSEEFNEGIEIIFQAQQRRQNSMYVSGWKFIETEQGTNKKLEFRFTV